MGDAQRDFVGVAVHLALEERGEFGELGGVLGAGGEVGEFVRIGLEIEELTAMSRDLARLYRGAAPKPVDISYTTDQIDFAASFTSEQIEAMSRPV